MKSSAVLASKAGFAGRAGAALVESRRRLGDFTTLTNENKATGEAMRKLEWKARLVRNTKENDVDLALMHHVSVVIRRRGGG